MSAKGNTGNDVFELIKRKPYGYVYEAFGKHLVVPISGAKEDNDGLIIKGFCEGDGFLFIFREGVGDRFKALAVRLLPSVRKVFIANGSTGFILSDRGIRFNDGYARRIALIDYELLCTPLFEALEEFESPQELIATLDGDWEAEVQKGFLVVEGEKLPLTASVNELIALLSELEAQREI
jgi:hypothetical protein